jgi:4-amino-4-deoxy-L-arabinose transferase-like glycosyltransferase
MRLSTVVLSALGGFACYWGCRQVGVDRERSALGAALYLFNPILFSLSYSFMSDAQFVALLTISTALYLRGLRPDRPSAAFTIIGSFVAGLAFLERQQGALIPLAVAMYLVLSGRLRPNRAGVGLFSRVVALPAAMTVTYYLWFRFIHGIPKAQGDFLQKVRGAGLDGAALLAGRLSLIEATYVGLFVLPLAVAALLTLPRLLRAVQPLGWLAFAIWAMFVLGGTAIFWQSGRRMPYIPHYLSPSGVGSYDFAWRASISVRPTRLRHRDDRLRDGGADLRPDPLLADRQARAAGHQRRRLGLRRFGWGQAGRLSIRSAPARD